MENNDWVKPFIDKFFLCNNQKDYENLLQEKLNFINKPLYKYCYIIEDEKRNQDTLDYNIENFKNDELYFQNPMKFNDPFDCFLGFSQTQVIKELLIMELKRKRKLTPKINKEINNFINDEINQPFDLEKFVESDEFNNILLSSIPIIVEESGEEGVYLKDFIEEEFVNKKENRKLFVKLINNVLTVKDKQFIIELLFQNKAFTDYIKSNLQNNNKDDILRMTKNKMKFDIETNSIDINSNYNETFSFLEDLKIFIENELGEKINQELEELKELFNNQSKIVLNESRKLISNQYTVTCLSERMDAPLMWSHYANKHFGFCLEYDFTYSMLKRYPDLPVAQMMLFPVNYSEKRPLLTKGLFNSKTKFDLLKNKIIPPNYKKNIMQGLLFKSEDWSYEKEWRIFKNIDDKSTMKLPPARKVFLGANMEDEAKNKIIEIAKSKNILVYQMFLTMDKYKFDYYPVI